MHLIYWPMSSIFPAFSFPCHLRQLEAPGIYDRVLFHLPRLIVDQWPLFG